MAAFIRIIAATYLILIWIVFWGVSAMMPRVAGDLTMAIWFVAAIAASIPAAILYVFGQVADDVHKAAEHMKAIRTHFENTVPPPRLERDAGFHASSSERW